VQVGIAQVEGLADRMVGGAGERQLLAQRVRQPAGQRGARRDEQREVEQPGRPRRGAGARDLVEDQQLAAARPQPRGRAGALEDPQPDRPLVVGHRPAEVGDGQADGAGPHAVLRPA
jgi:hypothetical protein